MTLNDLFNVKFIYKSVLFVNILHLYARYLLFFLLQVNHLNLPSVACQNCFHKLIIFQTSLRKILKQRINKTSINDSMQHHPVSPTEKEEKSASLKMETKKEAAEKTSLENVERISCCVPVTPVVNEQKVCTDNYSCTCESCQSKFGALPILLQGIERKTMEENMEISQPSTSSGVCSDPTDKKKFLSCQYCNKSFHHKGDYNKHLRKHTKEKPFTCSVCNRKFSHTSNLQRHFRLHSGHKPFSCKNCHKKFSRNDKLESHKKSRLCKKRSNSNS